MNSPMIPDSDLHAYVDDALPAERQAEVERWLAGQPEAAARVRAWLAQKAALKALFNPVLDEDLPEALTAIAGREPVEAQPAAAARSGRWPLQRLAASLLISLLGGLGGWLAHERYPGGEPLAQAVPLARQAAVAHAVYSPDVRRPVEVTADQEEQLVKWLSKRLGTPVNPPRLGGLGFELVGGRLLPGNSGPVAQFMYQDGGGQRLTLYVSTEAAGKVETGFRFAREGAVNVFYWVDGRFGYALSAGIDKGELARVATAVYDQLEHAR
jgi:anti-sigma factor RsiW